MRTQVFCWKNMSYLSSDLSIHFAIKTALAFAKRVFAFCYGTIVWKKIDSLHSIN